MAYQFARSGENTGYRIAGNWCRKHILIMDTEDPLQSPTESHDGHHPIQCRACESALESPGRESVSFLLLDQLTIPLVGCDEHLQQFTSLCDLTTEQDADLLTHRPAGGVHCPGCRHAGQSIQQPVIPVEDGGLVVLACSTHQSAILDRFQTGLQIRHQLNSSLDTFSTRP